MFYKNNCYIYSETRAGTSYREDFRTLDTPESFRVSRASLVPTEMTWLKSWVF